MQMCRKLMLAVVAVVVAWGVSAGTSSAQTGTIWSYKDGYFRRTGPNAWSEYQKGKLVYTFKESFRDDDEVHIHDSSRGITVKIRGDKAGIWSGTDLLGTIGDGRWVWQAWTSSNKQNVFRHVGNKKWEERQNGQVAFTFTETYRNANEIHIYDSTRNFTVKLSANNAGIFSGTDNVGNYSGSWTE